ncbi:MAG: Uncharacterized protein FD161_3886 [Limisphaerales bacterium]|nr:MAG: Uncharacterized protein FD161_3886 [Limisphaerales bacterium]KAG0507336.1 MAG: Uncharacterized protein E1N63_3483 [Limisphaerales bacterium]TXT51657.1 MAG: Uncharacterized protein FD140_1461 [Limisphaerales bacterium]
MQKWLNRIFQIIWVVGLLLLVVRLANWGLSRSRTLPVPPQANGYEPLVLAAREVKSPSSDLAELSQEQARQLAEENKPVLAMARKSLAMDSGVTLDTKKGWQNQHNQDLKDFKRLAVAFAVEAKSHLQAGRTNEAAGCHLEVIRLAKCVSHGGILVDGITGLALEVIGGASLQSLLPQLDAAFCRESAVTLEKLLAARAQPEAIITTEQAWSRRQFGLVDVIGGWLGREGHARRFAEFSKKANDATARTQRLMLRLAARAYELDEKRPPATVAELVPKYLKTVPLDLQTGKAVQEIPALVK